MASWDGRRGLQCPTVSRREGSHISTKGWETATLQDVRDRRLPKKKANKYHAQRTEVDGIVFASKKEANRWMELRALQHAGEIYGLIRQPRYGLHILPMLADATTGRIKIADYDGDFQYYRNGVLVLEDVKGGKATKTAVYRLKKKIVEALYGITITEV